MPHTMELTKLIGHNSIRPASIPSLYSLCIRKIQRSSRWEHCVLSTPVRTIQFDLLTKDMHKNPIFFIATHYQASDGEMVTGCACGYHITMRIFLIGVFQTCVCFEPKHSTQWVHNLAIDQVADGDFEANVRDLLTDTNGSVDEKGARLCLRSIVAWAEKHREPLQKSSNQS